MKLKKFIILNMLIFLIGLFSGCNNNSLENNYKYEIKEQIESINIYWSNGTINFKHSDDGFFVEENSDKDLKHQLSYSISNSILTINFDSNNNYNYSKNLTIWYNLNQVLDSIYIEGLNINTTIKKQNISTLLYKTKVGTISVFTSNISKVKSNINTSGEYDVSTFENSTIGSLDFTIDSCHYFSINSCKVNNANIIQKKGILHFVKNKFNDINITKEYGEIVCEIIDLNGYCFDINSNTLYLDFETINHNNLYIYKTPLFKLSIINKHGVTNIKRV